MAVDLHSRIVAVALRDSPLFVDMQHYDFDLPCEVQETSGKETERRNGTMLKNYSLRGSGKHRIN